MLGHRGINTSHISTFEGDSVFFLLTLHRLGHVVLCEREKRFSGKDRSAFLERFRLKSGRFQYTASCEVRGGEFKVQSRFLVHCNQNLRAADKILFDRNLCSRQGFFEKGVLMGMLSY